MILTDNACPAWYWPTQALIPQHAVRRVVQ